MTISDGQSADQASAPIQPERVGPYVIESKIGAGGMGTVYHGRHADTGDEAAVKVLPASLAREEGFVARFFREIEALKKLVDPHVVRLYESGVDGETYYYAMEYVDGETLTARLRREKRIPWRETIEIAIEICAALKAAHDAGVVHRDLKPSNLLLARDGAVKLTDFGVAQIFAENRLTVTGGIIGTAEYMSPEQAQGKRATKKSDLYSLGAVMYVMLTGRPPFRGKTTLDVIQQQRYGQFDRPRRMVPEIPSWLDDIVVQLLEKDPEKRFADAYVLMRRLQEVLRKVDLSEGDDETRASGARGGTGATVVGGSAVAGGPGAGTIMRDLVRAELEQAGRKTPFGKLLNSTWFLVILLLLVIGGGVLWFQRDTLPAVEEARVGDSFEPRKIPRLFGPADEAQTFLQRAQHEIDTGEFSQAERTLTALSALLDDQPEHKDLRDKAAGLLKTVQARRVDPSGGRPLLQSSMERAEKLLNDGNVAEARKIWENVIELYAADADAQRYVERARNALERAEAASDGSGDKNRSQ